MALKLILSFIRETMRQDQAFAGKIYSTRNPTAVGSGVAYGYPIPMVSERVVDRLPCRGSVNGGTCATVEPRR